MFQYILALASTEATIARAGGKGANLATLARAGFAVPAGFIVTTAAYQRFVATNQIQPQILALAARIAPEDLGALEATSAAIRALFEQAVVPPEIAAEIAAAYQTLLPKPPDSPTPAPVAIRSSATAEDLPGLAFAGQQDTYLNVAGAGAVLAAVQRCWGSLWTARALAYRARNHIPAAEVSLAVVVQQLIAAAVSGVLFTANPLTGRRDEMVIDASFGLGEAIVAGQVDPDHYVVHRPGWQIRTRKLGAKALATIPRAAGGTEQVIRPRSHAQALPDQAIIELAQIAGRVATLFGAPQDIEWAWAHGRFDLLQSRPITSLYPLPERPEPAGAPRGTRLYINFNAIQGVTDPLTPLGIDALRLIFGAAGAFLHLRRAPRDFLPDAGGRLFLDCTELVGDRRLRPVVLAFLAHTDPAAQQILRRLIQEGRFPSTVVLTPRRALALLPGVLPILRSVLAALWRPERVRPRVLARAEQFITQTQHHARAARDLPARLRSLERDLPRAETVSLTVMPTVLPAFAAIPVVDRWLTRWLGEPPRTALRLMRGLPGNLTIAMNLKLWAVAQRIRADGPAVEWLRTQPVETLVAAYRQGALPAPAQQALAGFLHEYGMRGVAEIDLGRPSWREDPTQILQVLCGYLQLEDPSLAPDVLFQRGAEAAERLAAEYVTRVRQTRFGWLRARMLAATIRRMRLLGGLREAPLFCLVQMTDIYRTVLLDSAQKLVAVGILACAEDIFFLPLPMLKQLAQGQRRDWQALAAANRAHYERERARRQMPRILLSTGEAFYDGMGVGPTGGTNLTGEAVSPGVAEGRAQVVLDPQRARLAPGDILVCRATDPGWTPLFLTAGGLVMEIGGLITHGSVVAREYGIPAVVGVQHATTRLQTGQRIRVDGNSGCVTVLEAGAPATLRRPTT